MKRYTIDDVMAFRPCEIYSKDRVEELWAGREALDKIEISELSIPIMDVSWVMSRLCADPTNRVARRIAIDVVHLWDPPAIVMAWLHTGDEEILTLAWAAARDAKTILRLGRVAFLHCDVYDPADNNAAMSAIWSTDSYAIESSAYQAAQYAASAIWYDSQNFEAEMAARRKYLEWMMEGAE